MSEGSTSSTPDFRLLFESSPGLYLVLDPRWRIAAATDAYLEATLTTRDQIVGRSLFDAFPDAADNLDSQGGRDMLASLNRMVATRRTDVLPLARHDMPALGPDGGFEVRYWSATNTPLFDDDGALQYVLHRVENVTEFALALEASGDRGATANVTLERMAAEIVERRAEVAEATTQLKQANLDLEAELEQARRLESLGQLAGGVAHDFNNLLAVIMTCAAFVDEAVAKAADGADAEVWEPVRLDVEQIGRAAERAVRLTRQLLTFARREVVRPTILNVNDIVSDVEALLRRTLGSDIEFRTSLGADLWTVCIDHGQFEQVLVNLAVNARGAMPTGGTLRIDTGNEVVDDEYAAQHPGLEPGRYVRLRVGDSGVGMEPEVLNRAFEPFFTTKPAGEGTGLGLATVHGIINQAGGYVHIYSEVGIGTIVSALLPVMEGETTSVAPSSLTEVSQPIAGHGDETVLVIEDEDAIRSVTCRILARNGYRVLSAASGVEARSVVDDQAGPIDLLLTDVMGPQMTGRELVAELRSRYPHLRVLYMSGYAHGALAARGTLDEDVEFIEKPFSQRALLAKVRQLLDSDPAAPSPRATS